MQTKTMQKAPAKSTRATESRKGKLRAKRQTGEREKTENLKGKQRAKCEWVRW